MVARFDFGAGFSVELLFFLVQGRGVTMDADTETEELINLNNKASNCGGNNSKSGDGFIDRSKVRILLCDNDSKSSEEVFTLLLRCSYQGMN